LSSANITTTPVKSAPDEADIIGDISSSEQSHTTGITPRNSTAVSDIPFESSEFLSWLESPEPLQMTSTLSAAGTSNFDMMDDFLDEVFGGEISSDIIPAVVSGLERELGDIIRSSFPDLMHLRSLISDAGYVPSSLRGQIWTFLLNGSSTEDQEAEFWHSSGKEINNQNELENDCNALVDYYASVTTDPSMKLSDPEQAKSDLKDLLVLYCVRRGTAYHPFLCHLLAPLVVQPFPLSRSLASSCFYSLGSGFIPLINLQVRYFAIIDLLKLSLKNLLFFFTTITM